MPDITISESVNGAAVADALSGGGTGFDIGPVVNGGYTTSSTFDKPSNVGSNDLYIRHDSVTDPLNNLAIYLEYYSQAYGGVATASADYARLLTMAEASGGSKNNLDGLTQGYFVDMDWDASIPSQFDYVNFGPAADSIVTGSGGKVRILRRTNGGNLTDDGSTLATRITVVADAMFLDPTTAPGAPLDGTIGKSGDAALGDRCLLKHRLYLAQSEVEGGIFQFDETFVFTTTA